MKTGRLISADRVNYQAASSGPCKSLVHLQQGEVASHTPPKKLKKNIQKKKRWKFFWFYVQFFFFFAKDQEVGGAG